MGPLSTAARRVVLLGLLGVLFALLLATPAAAHAELVSITPANGAQLKTPPTEVQMIFTESVNLIDGGIRLIDDAGATVPTPDPSVDGHTVSWPMPAELPDGAYVVTWRVVSADGHPVSGASSFGVGAAAAAVPGSATGAGSADTTGSTAATGSSAPWSMVAVRLAGYVAFALFAGVAAFLLFCAPDTSKDPHLQRLARGALIGGAAAAVAALLVQGPYTAGVSMSRVLDTTLLQQTLATPFGAAMAWRLALYGVLGMLAWRLPKILGELAGWLVPAGVVGIAVTIAASGHAAAAGPIDLGIDALHALTAGLWVGGLAALVALGRSVEPRALHRFSTLAMASVLTLIATGTLNSLRELDDVEQLWQTRYGLTLLVKLTLVAGTLAAAAASRHRLKQHQVPLRSVRLEAALTVAVLTVTGLLSMTAAPPQMAQLTDHAGHGAAPAAADDTVQMSLGDQGNAALTVMPATTAGSHLHLILTDTNGRPLAATRVTLKVANPGRDIAPIPVPMSMDNGVWVASYRFPFPGIWKAILTVDGIGRSAVVTTADITIRD
jgi:copper transport protein